jgi:diguanylate cyclase
MSSQHSVADTARATLLLLAERELPATPENYARLYAEVAGEPVPAAPPSGDTIGAASAEIVHMVRSLVDLVVDRTATLAADIGQHNQGIKQTVDELRRAQEKELVLRLAEALTTKADSIHGCVDSTQRDLEGTRLTLQRMSLELSETRQSLLEDALTGAQNRRGMDAILSREVARAKRNKDRLTVAMIDIDHFKQVNDTYGHDVGDRLLAHVSMIAKSVLRDSDSLVRYGGEEFLLILPEADIKGGEFVLDRLRVVIARSPLMDDQRKIEVTFSGGLAQLKDGENGHNLVLRADRALYEAKRAGRNCVRVAE